MTFTKRIRSTVSLLLVSTFLFMSMQSSLQAAVIGNDQLVTQSTMQIQRDEVATFLARDDVRSSLMEAGVSSNDVDQRVNNLSDSQVLQIHAQMNDLPAGGGVLGAIVLIIVIFILLDVAGATDVFPGI